MDESKYKKIDSLVMKLKNEIKTCGVNPCEGLPESLFLFVSSITPLVNVDLLIRDEQKGVLLSWRDEEYNGKGWHIPGGIIRLKERALDRVQKTALGEIGTRVICDEVPLIVHEDIVEVERQWLKDELERSHFISMLFECRLPDGFEIKAQGAELFPGYLRWFDYVPENLLDCHKKLYGDILERVLRK